MIRNFTDDERAALTGADRPGPTDVRLSSDPETRAGQVDDLARYAISPQLVLTVGTVEAAVLIADLIRLRKEASFEKIAIDLAAAAFRIDRAALRDLIAEIL